MTVAHQSRDTSFHPLWGPVRQLKAGHATDDEVRYLGSSGGVLSALAIYLLENGLVQGVLHVAPDAARPYDNPSQISRTREDVLRAAGSRYAPASPLDRVRECLDSPGVFAFIGKPCDVAALRAIAARMPDVSAKFRYMLSFMCAGTPSLRGTEQVVRHLGFDPSEVARFRYRGNGWPGMARAETSDGRSAEMDYDSSWGKILNRYLQFRCKICPDGTGEFADISCADAWHADERGYPIFTETSGRSLVIARTAEGRRLLEEAEQTRCIATEGIEVASVAAMQPYQTHRKQALIARLVGFRLGGQHVPQYHNFELAKAAASMPFVAHIKNALGAWLRATGLRRTT
ncbi:Coenzyme F420 hydrogenase/dehydrogenase, beta subunit C-terminal domain [Methyloversatilis discipulorum]|uniref:Coenzyme F420 hydrogenase/dehydrogenase, beta subunit C-terminal domain n=1 Tax=Methyloversatilis discipulorum TaxID=1119528 RepID=UPI003F672DF3